MKIIIPLGLLLVLACSWLTQAQIPKPPASVQSPNAASLGLYGEVPVSLYSGLPAIEIPLYTVQEHKLTVPISLSYHASGFRPDVHPSWVGMGWNLNAGGMITRTVNGFADELDETRINFPTTIYDRTGSLYNRNLVNRPDWSSADNIKAIADVERLTPDLTVHPFQDTEPDAFNFNFDGYSGTFYLAPDGGWRVKCNRAVTVTSTAVTVRVPGVADKISPLAPAPLPFPQYNHATLLPGVGPSFAGFTLTTEEGTQYLFGGDLSAVEYQEDFFGQNTSYWSASAWHLTQIIHPDGQQINFTYEREPHEFTAQMYLGVQDILGFKVVNAGLGNTRTDCMQTRYYSINDSYGGKLLAPVYLTKIQTATCTVYFDRAKSKELTYEQRIFDAGWLKIPPPSPIGPGQLAGFDLPFPYLEPLPSTTNPQPPFDSYPYCLQRLTWRKLTGIRIVTASAGPAQLIKHIALAYNNDDSTNTAAQYERLTLLQVTEQGTGGISRPPYRFGYNKYHSLPGYLTDQIDHWGFYNANPLTNCSYEVLSGTFANQPYYKTYLTHEKYYAHREPNPDSAVYLAGMLTRLVYPTGGVTEFTYEQHSFGKQVAENRFTPPQPTAGDQVAGGVRIRKITSYPLNQPAQALTKEYLYVTGYSPTAATTALPSSGILGARVRYSFPDYQGRAFNDESCTVSWNIFTTQSQLPASSNSQGSHLGYSTVVEKRSDGSYTKYDYSNFDSNLDEPPLTVLHADLQTNRTIYSPYSSTDEERGKLLQEEYYTTAGICLKRKRLDYYAYNKDAGYVPAIKATSSYLCSDSRVDDGSAYKLYTYSYLPVQETETFYDAKGTTSFTTTTNTAYNEAQLPARVVTTTNTGINTTIYTYPQDYTYPTGPLSNPVVSTLATMSTRHMLKYPVETVVYHDPDPTSYTSHPQLLSASVQTFRQSGNSIQPYQFYMQELATPARQYTGLQFTDGASPPTIPGTLRLTFTDYDFWGNVLGVKKPGGQSNSYLWGYANTLPVAQIQNATTSQVATALTALGLDAANLPTEAKDLQAAFTQLRHQLPQARITSYTYAPLVGITSLTDPSGRTITYEYDGLQRLIRTRDEQGRILSQQQYHYAGTK